MSNLGKAIGLFDLRDSDRAVGSMLSKVDVKSILGVSDSDITLIPFKLYNNTLSIDELYLQRIWANGKIPNAHPPRIGKFKVSFDEYLLLSLIKLTYPDADVQQQVPWGRRSIDFKVSRKGVSKLIEFHGPTHFVDMGYGSLEDPFIRKDKIEQEFSVECVIWPYWIQRCKRNVSALFDASASGLGALWSATRHFGEFEFKNSADIILKINKRFQADRIGGIGYFYGPATEGRNNPMHPIIDQIANGHQDIDFLIPRGSESREYWVPDSIRNQL